MQAGVLPVLARLLELGLHDVRKEAAFALANICAGAQQPGSPNFIKGCWEVQSSRTLKKACNCAGHHQLGLHVGQTAT